MLGDTTDIQNYYISNARWECLSYSFNDPHLRAQCSHSHASHIHTHMGHTWSVNDQSVKISGMWCVERTDWFSKTSPGPGPKYSTKSGGWKTWWLGNMVAGMRGGHISTQSHPSRRQDNSRMKARTDISVPQRWEKLPRLSRRTW